MYWDSPSAWRVAFLILLYIQQEFAIDRTHTLGDRIYKVIREQRGSTQTSYTEGTSGALGPVLEETFPEIETTVRIWRWTVSVQYGERKDRYLLALVDDNFLDVFDFPLIKGDLETAFRTPYSVVITDDMAQHLFGDTDPMGKTVSIDSRSFPGRIHSNGHRKSATSLIQSLFSNPLNHNTLRRRNARGMDIVATHAIVASGKNLCAIKSRTKRRNPTNKNAAVDRAVYGG